MDINKSYDFLAFNGIWSEFSRKLWDDVKKEWKQELIYYHGDHSSYDKDDWRFCDITNKREMKFLQLIEKQ